MKNELTGLNETRKWHLMIGAAKRGAEQAGYKLQRVPGRGLSNVWKLEKDGKALLASIRTTRDRWIAFPPLAEGTKWKTLDDVDLVLVSTVDDKDHPQTVAVYLFDAAEVRKRFDAAYSARIKAGNIIRDGFGMWVALDTKDPGPANSVGSGLADKHKPIAIFSIASLTADNVAADAEELDPETDTHQSDESLESEPPLTIAEAKRRLARTLGIDPANIKITVEA